MGETTPHPDRAEPSTRWRWPIRLLLIGLLVLLIPGWLLYKYHSGQRRLERALAEADRLDPGWRWQELEAGRAIVPEEKNSALLVMKVAKLSAPLMHWEGQAPNIIPPELANPEQLNEKQIAWLRQGLQKLGPVLSEARKLADMPRGRYPIQWNPDNPYDFRVEHLQDARSACRLLHYDVLLRAQDGDIEGAMTSCRGMLNAARSIGDEPTLISMLVRIALRGVAIYGIERTLAQGEASESALQDLQQRLEEEVKAPLLLIGLRGERASHHQLMEALKSGRMSLAALDKLTSPSSGGDSLSDAIPGLTGLTLHSTHAALLEYSNQAVEIAKRPIQEQLKLLEKLEASLAEQPALIRSLAPAFTKLSMAHQKTQAQLHCTIAALAAERYRLARAQWPESLEQLVPQFLTEAPVDPFGKGPVKMIRVADGLVIYSVALDGEDNGGKLSDRWMDKGNDLGVKLWDLKHRRQPPKKVETE